MGRLRRGLQHCGRPRLFGRKAWMMGVVDTHGFFYPPEQRPNARCGAASQHAKALVLVVRPKSISNDVV